MNILTDPRDWLIVKIGVIRSTKLSQLRIPTESLLLYWASQNSYSTLLYRIRVCRMGLIFPIVVTNNTKIILCEINKYLAIYIRRLSVWWRIKNPECFHPYPSKKWCKRQLKDNRTLALQREIKLEKKHCQLLYLAKYTIYSAKTSFLRPMSSGILFSSHLIFCESEHSNWL